MGVGLQVFNANSKVILDSTSATTRYLGKGNTGAVDGELVDERINADDIVWVSVLSPSKKTNAIYGYRFPRFTQVGNKLKWEVSPSGASAQTGSLVALDFIYGVY